MPKIESLNKKGIELMNKGEHDNALKSFNKVLNLDPNNINALFYTGYILFTLEKYDEALAYFNKVLEIDPSFKEAWYNKGRLLRKFNDIEGAIKCHNKALEIDPEFKYSWNAKGIALYLKKDFEGALECYERALKQDPNFSEALYNIGLVLHEQGNLEGALQYYDKAIKINPHFKYSWNRKGQVLFSLERNWEALQCYKKAIEISDNFKEVWYNMAKLYHQDEDYKNALKCYDKALEIAPGYSDAWKDQKRLKNEIREKIINILNHEKELGRVIDKKEMIKDLNIRLRNVDFLINLIETTQKYEKEDEEEIEAVSEDVIKMYGQPTYLDLLDYGLSIKFGHKVGYYLVEKGLLNELLATPNGRVIILSKELKQVEKVEEIKQPENIFIGRGGVWEVNRLIFKVKVQNKSPHVITSVAVSILQYPTMLKLLDQNKMKETPLIQPNGGIWTPEFRFDAGNECISGEIRAMVIFFDHKNNKHVLDVRSFDIKYICPLLEAKKIGKDEYSDKIKNMTEKEHRIKLEKISDTTKVMKEIESKFTEMNLGIVDFDSKSNKIISYAEDKIKRDGLALEAILEKFEHNQEIIIRALCEHDNKCAPLLYKAVEELSTIGLSTKKNEILNKLNLFLERPDDLKNYIKRVIKSDWTDEKKDEWANVMIEILEDWKQFKPSKWKKIGSLIKGIISGFIGDELTDLMSSGINNLYRWVITNLK
ncbi:MAG: tetratricopeptide repeat protein [Promethearchaeota archaeon]